MAEKIRAEAALQESRNFTDKLIETANVMIVGLDAKGDVNVFNPAAEKTTGYSLSNLQGKNWFELLTPKERYPQVHAEFSRLMGDGLPGLFENPILTKTGDERFISWSNNQIRQDNKIIGVLSFGLDITQRKQAEEQLQQYQQRLKALASQLTITEEKERRVIAAVSPGEGLDAVRQAWNLKTGGSGLSMKVPALRERLAELDDELGVSTNGVTINGLFSEEVVVDAQYLVPVPADLSSRRAILTEPLAVNVHALKKAKIEKVRELPKIQESCCFCW